MSNKPIIEHDRHERPRKRGDLSAMWVTGFVMLAGLWVWYLITQPVSWFSLGLGGLTGFLVMAWAAEMWGDRPYSGTTKVMHDDARE